MARKSRKHLQDAPIEQKPVHVPQRYIVGIYARTSSEAQKGDSIENQEKIGKQYIESNPEMKLNKVYIDYGISSFARVRSSFEDMLFDIESKTINCVIVKDISRFSREYLEACDLIQRKFPLWGIRFVSVSDDFDSLYHDTTKLEIALKSLLSYSYSLDLSKKIQSAINIKQKSGSYTPAKLPYGYIKSQAEQGVEWQLNEETAPIVIHIFARALKGISSYSIASELNKRNIKAPSSDYWTSGSILRVLRNASYVGPFMTGKTRNNKAAGFKTDSRPQEEWIKHYNHHTPIVDDIAFHTVQHMLSKREIPYSARNKVEDFFCGKLYCGMCKRKMRSKRSANGNIYYICPRRDESASSCVNKAKSETKLKKQIFLIICNWMNEHKERYYEMLTYENSLYFRKEMSAQAKQIQTYQRELEQQNQLFETLYEDGVNRDLTHSADYRELMAYLRRVRSMLAEQITGIEQSREDYLKNRSSIVNKYQFVQRFQEKTALTAGMVSDVVERVYVDIDGIRVVSRLGD